MADKPVTLEEGAAMLVDRLRFASDREEAIKFTIQTFRQIQAVAIQEARIVLELGGTSALHRLFNHHKENV